MYNTETKNGEEYLIAVQIVWGLCYGLQLLVFEAEMLVGKTDFNIKPTNPQIMLIDAY